MTALQTALLVALLGLSPLGSADVSDPYILAFTNEITISALEDDVVSMLETVGLTGSITARIKTPESLAAKAARKGLSPDQVLDRVGMRVQMDSIEACYTIFAQINSHYTPVPGSQDDYIAHPKANGYQSLHTAVHTPFGVVEYQIRTPQMHEHAERGGAAHGRYKATQRAA